MTNGPDNRALWELVEKWREMPMYLRSSKCADELAAILERPVVVGWLPIESAPKDGTEVWTWNGEQGRMMWIDSTCDDEAYSLWVWSEELLSDIDPEPEQPTHWMPLPAEPETNESMVRGKS